MTSLLTVAGEFAGGLGLFLLGMGLMTEGLKLAAGRALAGILGRWTRTRFRGLLAGVLVTSLVQSSSAVTVATIGFVNAGLLTLAQAIWSANNIPHRPPAGMNGNPGGGVWSARTAAATRHPKNNFSRRLMQINANESGHGCTEAVYPLGRLANTDSALNICVYLRLIAFSKTMFLAPGRLGIDPRQILRRSCAAYHETYLRSRSRFY